jgi:hypothetical protein
MTEFAAMTFLRMTMKVFAGLALATLAGIPALSFGGFCFKQQRFLLDDEYFDIAISKIISLDVHPINVSGAAGVGYAYVHPIRYKDIAEFREQNPDCCAFVQHNSGLQVGSVYFCDRLFGLAARSVHLSYKIRYLDDHQETRTVATEAQFVLGNCGQILDTQNRR